MAAYPDPGPAVTVFGYASDSLDFGLGCRAFGPWRVYFQVPPVLIRAVTTMIVICMFITVGPMKKL